MRVRTALASDLEAIARLQVESWRAVYRNELPATFLAELNPTSRAERWGEWLAEPGRAIHVISDLEGLIAFSASAPTADRDLDPARVWQIYSLHVAVRAWGKGAGKALFDESCQAGRSGGRAELSLWVVDTNTRARRFYEREGLEGDGRTQRSEVGPGAFLYELRYRGPIP